MTDRPDADPILEILDELERVRARETELIVQLCAALRAAQGPPAPPPRPLIRLQVGYYDSQGTLVVLGSRVRFTGTARSRAGTGRVVSWTNRANPQRIADPYFRIERDVPGQRFTGPRFVHRKASSVTLLPHHS